jgi:hypothetical protein
MDAHNFYIESDYYIKLCDIIDAHGFEIGSYFMDSYFHQYYFNTICKNGHIVGLFETELLSNSDKIKCRWCR